MSDYQFLFFFFQAEDGIRDIGGTGVQTCALPISIGNTGPAILQIEEAKQVCRRCEVREQCLAWALEAGQDHRVWGGLRGGGKGAPQRRHARGGVRARAGRSLSQPADRESTRLNSRHAHISYGLFSFKKKNKSIN